LQLLRRLAADTRLEPEANALTLGQSPEQMNAGATDSEALEHAEDELAEALARARSLSDTASGRQCDACGHRHPKKRRPDAAMTYSPKA
jgi:hypothetical protein